jgi:glycyl-tRNA synthetase
MITFQELIHRLSNFWEKKGCIIHQGHDLEVGAGTFNPATFLRCLGPEPYLTAYVEPSRRPADGRYGENPNRVQLFHQYQVVLKPSPSDIQQLYLQSLEAVGIAGKKHDIRFVHSDWESPTLGAWGLGWEVWCDGMEISQFTYFQAIGGLPLKPIPAEITYGLERLAMYIQNVDSIFDVRWNEKLTFRDILHRFEVEWSAYNFTQASTEMWMRHFDDFEKEAKLLIGRHLPIPAYDFVIKASHAFNILDARGSISVTQRTGYIARVRELAHLIAIEYLTSREKLGFPLLEKEKKPSKAKPRKIPTIFNPKAKQDFLLEIGSEELPDQFVPLGMGHLEKALCQLFQKEGLSFDAIALYATPRRLTAHVRGLAEGTPNKMIERKGPAVPSAFTQSGSLTPQGKGFLKSLGFAKHPLETIRKGKVKGLEIRSIKGNDYLFALLEEKGKSTLALLAEQLPHLILSLDFPKKMRWGTLDISYARPLHWIAALFGDHVIPFQLGDLFSDRFSFGHAQLKPQKFVIDKPRHYLSLLKKYKVLADVEERKKSIVNQLVTIEKKLKAVALEKNKVLSQVLYLAEWPQLTYASFDAEFLKVPPEVLTSEMVEHQKYFPLADKKGKLIAFFVITADNTPSELIRKGNQKVLSARLNDGVFLYSQDRNIPLEQFNEKLQAMTFQKELGSMLDKVMRLVFHADTLNQMLALADQKKLLRAALLCKADLASALVSEFPDLQGTIGKYYALFQKEDSEVARAIEEHWMPKSEEAPLPLTPCGIVLSLADKIDNLLSYFSIGLKPSSSSDQYGLRRQTLGLLKILIQNKFSLNLKKVLRDCSRAFSKLERPEPLIEEILFFMTHRAKSLFEDYGFKKDEIEASLQASIIDPYDQFCKVKALHEFRKQGDEFSKLFEVYKRAKGQLEEKITTFFNPELCLEPAEKELTRALMLLNKHWKDTVLERNYTKAFHLIAALQPPLARLFDTVKILSDDPILRDNRIALLQKVFSHFEELLDFSRIQS